MMSDGLECVTCVYTGVYTCTSSTCATYTCTQFTNSKQGGDEELERESDIHVHIYHGRQKTTHMYVHICVSDACVPKKKEVSF